MLPFPTPPPPQDPAPAAADQPQSAAAPSTLGATPAEVPFSPAPQKGIPWLLVGAAVGVVGAGTALTWWMLRKKSGTEARLDNPIEVQVETKKPGSTPKPKPTEPVFTLDDEPETFTLTEFLDNNEHLSGEDLEQIEIMKVGDEHALGGGAWARFVLKRVA